MKIRRTAALLLALLLAVPAFAADVQQPYTEADVAGRTLEQVVTEFREANRLTEENFALSYYNTVTGEEYSFNDSRLMYGASTYKVPLNMYFYEMQAAGEISGDEHICASTLDECHRESILYSNNELSFAMIYRLGQIRDYKESILKYITVPVEEIPPEYYYDHLFSTRMMMDILKYLYAHEEDFTEMLGYMKEAVPNDYFREYTMDMTVAHKYGDYNGFHNDVGIFYTEEPFLLAVYTQGLDPETVARAGALMRTYNEYQTREKEARRQARVEQRAIAEQKAAEQFAEREAFEKSVREQQEKAEAAAAAVKAQLEAEALQREEARHEAEQKALQEQVPQPKESAFEWWMPVVALGIFGLGGLIVSGSAKHLTKFSEESEENEEEQEL